MVGCSFTIARESVFAGQSSLRGARCGCMTRKEGGALASFWIAG